MHLRYQFRAKGTGLGVHPLDVVPPALCVNTLPTVCTRRRNIADGVCGCLQRLLNYVVPEAVHIMEAGRIIYSGGIEVADILEKDGYEGIRSLIKRQAANGKQAVSA